MPQHSVTVECPPAATGSQGLWTLRDPLGDRLAAAYANCCGA